ncbi:MAG: EF-Tu/IF-2/RF-3 family GTPase [Actinomycetota bacterium]|nr:EF-Tu/IF-2/RF-3 family GTPase [Actinomycetota bacterium]
MEEVGKVTHYFAHIQVAVVDILSGELKVGDRIKISGHTTDFEQTLGSMEVERKKVERAAVGDLVAIKVESQVRENDLLFKLT